MSEKETDRLIRENEEELSSQPKHNRGPYIDLASEIRANTTPEEMALRLEAAANVFPANVVTDEMVEKARGKYNRTPGGQLDGIRAALEAVADEMGGIPGSVRGTMRGAAAMLRKL